MAQLHARFDEVLEAVEALPEEQQERLIDIVRRRRRIERRRAALVASIHEARRELAEGAARRGPTGDLLDEL